MKVLFTILLQVFGYVYVCFGQPTIYVAPAPKTYWEQKADSRREALILQTMLADEAERKLARANEERSEYVRRSMSRLEQVKRMYSSFDKYPLQIASGWHKVIVTNNIDFCEERKVWVGNNKISEYVVDNWSPRTVVFSSPIKDGKAIIKLSKGDGTETEYHDVYFIENIIDPSSSATLPLKQGMISFYTNSKKVGVVKISIEGEELGNLTNFIDGGMPSCGQVGTLSTYIKPGTYRFQATNGRQTWNGSFSVGESSCVLQGLNR